MCVCVCIVQSSSGFLLAGERPVTLSSNSPSNECGIRRENKAGDWLGGSPWGQSMLKYWLVEADCAQIRCRAAILSAGTRRVGKFELFNNNL